MKITRAVKNFIYKYNLNLIFIISFIGTFISLYFEHILKLPVCDLCWIERIFFYPIVIISLIALIIKDKNAYWYILTLSIINLPITLYHHLLKTTSLFQNNIDLCTNKLNSCSKLDWELIPNSNITIPFLAFIGLTLITILSLSKLKSTK